MSIHSTIERRIVAAIIDRAARKGWTFSVHDEEGVRLRETADKRAVLNELGDAEIEAVAFHADRRKVGHVEFVWGNGEDVVHDWSDTPAMRSVVEGALDESARRGPVRENPKRKDNTLQGYLANDRTGTVLTDFTGKPLGWRVESVVSNWRKPNGDRVKALKLVKGSGKTQQVAGGLWLGDGGTLFRGVIVGRAPVKWDYAAASEQATEIVNTAEYWMERDAEDSDMESDDGDA